MYKYVLVALVAGMLGMALGQPRQVDASPLTLGSSAVTASLSLPDIFGVDLDDVLKLGGVVYVVSEFGDEINDAINTLLNNNDAATGASTKVVVIVTPQGKYVGAAQVTGPRAAVNRVNAVAQLEETFSKFVRIKALIPIEAEDASSIQRIKGVAVSAVIDIKL